MLVLTYHKYFQQVIWALIIILFSCNDAEYQLDNESDPENLGLEPPTIFFHPSEFDTIKVNDKDTLELYCYEVPDAAGAHLQIEFDAGVITIDTVFAGDFFRNDTIGPIIFTDPIVFTDEQNGTLNIYLFYVPSLSSVSATGTMSMAKVPFTVKGEGSAPIRYTENTVLRDSNNNSIILNKFGEGSINATQ